MSAGAAGDEARVVAIDGPAGVGKSTAARRLAGRLALPYLDTGAMYRALALKALESGVDPADEAAVAALFERTEIRLRRCERDGDARFEVLLDGEPVGDRIRTPEVSGASSAVAVHSAVRRRMVTLQQEGGRRFGAVVEGRDIGTRVFPETPYKFFLTAAPEVRARRRAEELRSRGRDVDLQQLTREIEARDERDSKRADSPLACDATYHLIDTSELGIDEVVEEMVRAVEAEDRQPWRHR